MHGLRALSLGICAFASLYACGHSKDDDGSSSHGGAGGAAGSVQSDAGAPPQNLGGGAGEAGQAGAADSGGAAASGEAGAAGEAGAGGAADPGLPITAGLIVVATTVTNASSSAHFVVLLDPSDGHEIARTRLPAQVLGLGHEAQRDLWFVFAGDPGAAAAEPNATLFVGTMSSTGFQITHSAQVPKPTNQNTIAILNDRILYRISTHAGVSQIDDTLLLLDTTSDVSALGKLVIPWRYALVTAAGVPTPDASAGGRMFFLHDNLDDAADNCMSPDSGPEDECTVYTSSFTVGATDRDLTFPIDDVSPVTQIDRDGSDAALGVQPSGRNVAIVAPPRRTIDTRAGLFWYDAQTGASLGAPELFSLESATKKLNPQQSITLPGVTLDPCNDRLFTGELANAALLYAVTIGTGAVVPFAPQTQNGIFGGIAYEPFTKTLIDFDSDVQKPTLLGFEIDDVAGTPSFVLRTATTSARWAPPSGLIPELLVVRNPLVPPCGE